LFSGIDWALIELVEPPKNKGAVVAPHPASYEIDFWMSDSFPGDENTTPPVCRLVPDNPRVRKLLPKKFSGAWRAGLALDCGKDLPAMSETVNVIPGKRFARDLEKAFGTKLVQIGFHY
jgi:hypothetical protein